MLMILLTVIEVTEFSMNKEKKELEGVEGCCNERVSVKIRK
jgi:hypothetical protein